MMMSCEWDDSEVEQRFVELNQCAAERGVTLRRVFVVKDADRDYLESNEAISWHFGRSNVSGYVMVHENLKRQDPKLLKKLGDGFIAFDRRVALIDLHSVDGSARGIVTMSSQEISSLYNSFEQLCLLAKLVQGHEAEGAAFPGSDADAPRIPASNAVDTNVN